MYRWLGRQAASHGEEPVPEPDAIETFDDHMLFYATHERARLASFLDASLARTRPADGQPLTGSTPRGQLDAVLERLGDLAAAAARGALDDGQTSTLSELLADLERVLRRRRHADT